MHIALIVGGILLIPACCVLVIKSVAIFRNPTTMFHRNHGMWVDPIYLVKGGFVLLLAIACLGGGIASFIVSYFLWP